MRLTDIDAAYLYNETASAPMHGTTLSVVEGELTVEAYHALVESRLHLLPRYRHRLAFVPFNLAHPKWVDDPDFDLHNHIKGHSLPPGSTVQDAVAALLELSEPLMPRDRPLWLTYVIDGVEGCTVIAQIAHHALVDGATSIDISTVLFDLQKNPPPRPAPSEPWQPAPMPTAAELTAEAMTELAEVDSVDQAFANTKRVLDQHELAQKGFDALQRMVTEPAITAPWNATTVGPKRRYLWEVFDFADFRTIRRAFGGTINDVVLTLATEAAARYLVAHGEAAAVGEVFRIMCPVNVRSEGESGMIGNRISGIFPHLPASRMPVVERLAKVVETTSTIKANQEAQAFTLLSEAGPRIPAAAMAPTLVVGTQFDPTVVAAQTPPPVPPRTGPRPPLAGFNFTCTNVPGVQVPQYLDGREVLHTMSVLMLGGNLGYGMSILSYNQRLSLNMICDPRLMPDLELMASGVRDVFNELYQAATLELDQQNPA